jgi:hypothetical protein
MIKYIYSTIIGLVVAGIIIFVKNNNDYFAGKLYQALSGDSTNLLLARERIACEESAKFINEFMPKVPSFADRFFLLKESIHNVDKKINGLYCEFGVGSGGTINYIASLVDVQIHGFDSFEGLPEDWRDGFQKGAFKMDTLPEVRPNVVLHKGWFNESLPKFKEAYIAPLSFLHMDADLYSSTKTVFEILGDRIVPGTVIQFDEFFNYPCWKDNEYKAFMEFVESHKVKYQFIGYSLDQQVAVKIIEISRSN